MRSVNLLAFGVLVGLVFLIYELKYETRRLEQRAGELREAIADEKDFLAVMRAEWSLVTRPERVQDLARRVLNMEPVRVEQIVPYADFVAGRPVPAPPEAGGQDGIAALIRRTVPGDRHDRPIASQ